MRGGLGTRSGVPVSVFPPGLQVLSEGCVWGGLRKVGWHGSRLTMREQIIIRISLRDDVPLRWPSCEDYSAPSWLPSEQPVAGSNPARRAGWPDLRKRFIVEPF